MSYVDSQLMQGEQVVYRTTIHWIGYWWPTVLFLFAGALMAGGNLKTAACIASLGGLFGAAIWLDIVTSEFAITDRRIITKVGVINRHCLELLLGNIEGVKVEQNILGRILGYGTLIISGTGSAKAPFTRVTAPLEFWRQVQQQISVMRIPY